MTITARNLFIFVILPILLIILSIQTQFFKPSEHYFYDLAFKTRPNQPIADNIALITIDDETLQFLGQWPLPRDYHAVLVDILTEFNAKAIFFDLIFNEASTYDAPLKESLIQANNTYLPIVFNIDSEHKTSNHLSEVSTPLTSVSPTLGNNHQSGHINAVIDSDGKIRKTLLYLKSTNGYVPQLALQLACDQLQLNCQKIEFHKNETIINSSLRIPVINSNEILVNYPGPWNKSFKNYSYLNILQTYDEYKNNNGPAGILNELKDKIFFIGLTAAGTVDLRANPIENNYPMLGLNASLLNSILSQRFIKPLSSINQVLMSIILFLISIWIALKYRPKTAFLGTLGLACGFLIFAILIFHHFNLWISMFLPLLIMGCVYISSASWRWLKEEKQRELLEKELLIASEIQEQFLISVESKFEEFDVATWFQPAKFVAGDLYDVFEIDKNRSGIFIGDVSGKGLPAALLMAQTISLFRIFSRQLAEPYAVLTDLNQACAGRFTGRFTTALYCIVDREKNRLQIASAGHEPLLIYRNSTQTLEEIPIPPNVPLGIMSDTEYVNIYASVSKGDQIILISDGVFEAHNLKGEEMGLDRVKNLILQNGGKSANEMLGCLKAGILAYTKNEPQFDDITLIVLSI